MKSQKISPISAAPEPINLFEFENFAKEVCLKRSMTTSPAAPPTRSASIAIAGLRVLGAAAARAARCKRARSLDDRVRHRNKAAGVDCALRRA